MIAVTRALSPQISECELTFIQREPIDVPRAKAQHEAYERALEQAGARLIHLPADDRFPDSVFVEDTAVVLKELAILSSPGTASRAGEVAEIALVLSSFRRTSVIEPPATLDGGDVLVIDHTIFVGETSRTNDFGRQALARRVEPFGYTVVPVPVNGCLHLKTGCTAIGTDMLLVNPAFIDIRPFAGMEILEVADGEPFAGNSLTVGDTIFMAKSGVRTADLLRSRGYNVECLDISELEKAEAGLTCMSILVHE
jgi:dimethylargininase